MVLIWTKAAENYAGQYVQALSIYRGSPTSTVSTSTNSTCTIFGAIGIELVLVEFLELAM